MTNNQAEYTLRFLKCVLDKLGVEFFIAYGTALGAYRDGDFMEGDRDVDIGTFEVDRLDEIREEMIKAGFRIHQVAKWQFSYIPCDSPNGTSIDFYFFRKGNKCWQNWVKHQEPGLFFPERFNKFEKINFKGMELNILSPAEEFFTWCYGDWKDKNNKLSAAYNWQNKIV